MAMVCLVFIGSIVNTMPSLMRMPFPGYARVIPKSISFSAADEIFPTV
jgi:hypothetical protein